MELGSVRSSDLEWVVRAVDTWSCTQRWELRGLTPPPGFLHDLLWGGVQRQRVARTAQGAPAALFQLVDVDLRNQVAHLDLMADPAHLGALGEPLAEFVRDGFAELPLRKVYIAAADDSCDPPGLVGSAVRFVGRLPEHQRRSASTFADVTLYELARGDAGAAA